jgi:hypothetical protein
MMRNWIVHEANHPYTTTGVPEGQAGGPQLAPPEPPQNNEKNASMSLGSQLTFASTRCFHATTYNSFPPWVSCSSPNRSSTG